jgi:hypothetical protein
MATRLVSDAKEEVYLEVELLNLACLDLVDQIERLEMENTQLKKKANEGKWKTRKTQVIE